MLRCITTLLAPIALAACATLPDQTIHYFRAQAATQLALTQTLSCASDGKHLLLGYSVVDTTMNKADPTKEWAVHIKDLDSRLADVALVFKFTEDHRLAGINTTQQGHGDAVLADFATTAGLFRALVQPMSEADACAIVNAAKDKTIALTYKVAFTYTPKDRTIAADSKPFTPDDATEVQLKLANKDGALLEGSLPRLTATWKPLVTSAYRVVTDVDTSDAVILKLNDTVPVHLAVLVTSKTGSDHEIWSQDIIVPFVSSADDYNLAIPKAALFGKQTFALTLADSGSISEIDLGKDSGTAAAISAADSAYTAVRGKTTAEKLAELKAADDLKQEQVRAAKCNADPTTC